jgi:hypothetical protein
MEKEKKKNKAMGCLKVVLIAIAALMTIILTIGICVVIFSDDKIENIEHRVRKEEVNATKTKTTIEIVLSQKESKERLEEISKQLRKKHKTENVLIFFFLTDTQKHNYAYAGWHGDKFDGIEIFQPVYGGLEWFIDSLKMPNAEITGIWGDTLEIPYVVGIIKQGGNIILKSALLDKKYMLADEYLQLEKNSGMYVFRNKKNPDEHESYSITGDKKLEIYERFYILNNEITGGKLQEILPSISY